MIETQRKRIPAALALMIALLIAGPAGAEDLAGAKDHPAISRYPEAVIDRYREEAFDELALITGRVKGKTAESSLDLEGRLTDIRYWIAAGHSTLEVFRNYEQALGAAGFDILFLCKNKDCGGRDFNHLAAPYTTEQGDAYEDQRYLAAQLKRPEGDLYAALYVNRAYGIGGEKKDRIYVQLTVLETAAMDEGLVTVDADAMRKGLEAEGHIALYGILFEFDSDVVRAESRPALEEIAALLEGDPGLSLLVVGHSDDQGSLDYNLDLSRRRARAVVARLVADHGVAAARLEGHGVGYLAPVADNRSEQGRALNRRVELVRRNK